MIFVNYKIGATKDQVMETLRDTNTVAEAEQYDTSRGIPKIHFKEKRKRIKISCEYLGRATKDNGFLEGTYFLGSVRQDDDTTFVRGLIVTAPIYHFIFLILVGLFIYQCFKLGGISIVPIILIIFNVFMFKDEFRKQGIIKRYIFRALKITYKKLK